MAKIGRGVLGSIVGTIRNINGYISYGQGIIRKKRSVKFDAPSLSQNENRLIFNSMVQFGLLSYANVIFEYVFCIGRRKTKWNWFIGMNRNSFNVDGLKFDAGLQLTCGIVPSSVLTHFLPSYSTRRFIVRWINTYKYTASAYYDIVHIAVYNHNLKEFIFKYPSCIRRDEFAEIRMSTTWVQSHIVTAFLFFTPSNGSLNSSVTSSKSACIL